MHQRRRSRRYMWGERFARNGFTVTVDATRCLVIEDNVGCETRILGGQAWITAHNAPHDMIVSRGMTVSLERGVRMHVGAFHELATLLIVPPRHSRDVVFGLYGRADARVLVIKSRCVFTWLGSRWASIAAMFGRSLSAARFGPFQGVQP